jgi:DNA-binding response OmpR family regulator
MRPNVVISPNSLKLRRRFADSRLGNMESPRFARSLYHLLLIEDDLVLQRAVVMMIPAEFAVTVAKNAKEAKDFLSKQTFDLIYLDLTLPDEDGLRLCNWIRSDPRHENTSITLVTGRGEVEDKVMAFSLGADEYLTKPVNAREFKARLQAKLRLLRRKEERDFAFWLGNLKFITSQFQLHLVEGESAELIPLTPLEFRLLYLLAEKRGPYFFQG